MKLFTLSDRRGKKYTLRLTAHKTKDRPAPIKKKPIINFYIQIEVPKK